MAFIEQFWFPSFFMPPYRNNVSKLNILPFGPTEKLTVKNSSFCFAQLQPCKSFPGPGWRLVASPIAVQGLGLYWLCFHFQHLHQKLISETQPTTGKIKCFIFQRISSEALILLSCICGDLLRPPSCPLESVDET